MIRVNQSMNKHINTTYPSISEIGAHDCDSSPVDKMYMRLAKLSLTKKWILFTADCPRPVLSTLSENHINCRNVIQMKSSSRFSEEEIVIKAIQAGTASAVVASANLDAFARAKVSKIAYEKNCEVFFFNQDSVFHHFCH